jgi:hypothetical protein
LQAFIDQHWLELLATVGIYILGHVKAANPIIGILTGFLQRLLQPPVPGSSPVAPAAPVAPPGSPAGPAPTGHPILDALLKVRASGQPLGPGLKALLLDVLGQIPEAPKPSA